MKPAPMITFWEQTTLTFDEDGGWEYTTKGYLTCAEWLKYFTWR